MFRRSARFYDALYHFKDYGAASRQLRTVIEQHHPNATTLLDVACGTARHLEYLREFYRVEGLDLNPEMIQIAQTRCPELVFHHGDMIDFQLGRTFDVVTCLFSSIGYVKTVENLERATARMSEHLQPHGVLMVEPWFTPETYWVGRLTANFVDEPTLKIAWMYTSAIENCWSVLDINFLVGTPAGIEYFTERHELGLFTKEEYRAAFSKAGLAVSYDEIGPFGRGMYIGWKDGARRG